MAPIVLPLRILRHVRCQAYELRRSCDRQIHDHDHDRDRDRDRLLRRYHIRKLRRIVVVLGGVRRACSSCALTVCRIGSSSLWLLLTFS